jgi:hypothetical protein
VQEPVPGLVTLTPLPKIGDGAFTHWSLPLVAFRLAPGPVWPGGNLLIREIVPRPGGGGLGLGRGGAGLGLHTQTRQIPSQKRQHTRT